MGNNAHGQLGLGHTNHVNTPHEIDAAHFGDAPIVAVACGAHHMLALTREGKLFSCGYGGSGATGHGHTTNTSTPQPVVGPLADARVVRIAAGYSHSCALTEDGQIFGVGTDGGVPAGGAQGLPQLLQGALADTTVRALGVGCRAHHSVFVAGPPPA
jgi:alpha-tubulin suppressor-like RCC1 family protein